MLKYLLKRIGLMFFTFIITVFLFFVFIKLMPDNFVAPIRGDNIWYETIKAREGWDQPIIIQFFYWVRNIFTYGTFGFSQLYREDVGAYYFSKIPATVRINLVPYFLSIPIAMTLGVVAALNKGKWIDNIISVGIMIFISIPYFVVVVLSQYFLYFRWNVVVDYKIATPSEFETLGTWYGISTYIFPVIVLTVVAIPSFARSVRAELVEQLTQDYMLLARSKGLSKRQATFRHALKNALVPFLPGIFIGVIGVINGGIITERLFRVDGTGSIYLAAFNAAPPDYAMLMLISTFGQFITLVSGIIGDVSYTLFDPRIRVGSGKLS
jgi:peptide/nickel transport system permease protein/oligopeptide transport system permease protein